jgi:NAD(P)-dependent dehydrogenase (short-subunit alcohol dehydrogenase family)
VTVRADGRLAGRTAIVFGGGHGGEGPDGVVGIGFACALTFAAHGANVVVVDRDEQAARRSTEAIETAGDRALAVVADLLDESQVSRAVAAALGEFGRLDVVLNNVGSVRLGGPEELTLEEWRAAVSINLDTVFLGAKATLAHLVATRGAMVNVSSTGSIRWTGYAYSSYAAAKAAVNQLTRSLALEYADRGVRINAVLPGLIDTPLVYRELSGGQDAAAVRAERARSSPTGAMGTAHDVANAALFLACDESAYVTGTLLPVDGGLHVRVI